MRWLMAGLAVVVASPAFAHSFGKLYTLPVPFWLYGWASAAALLLSFCVVAVFSSAPKPDRLMQPELGFYRPLPAVLRWCFLGLQGLACMALVLAIVSGLWGTQDAYRNINMTLFWIVFVLGLAYATVLVGDVFNLINPWRWLTRGFTHPRIRYPRQLAYWPAVGLYVGFIGLELLGDLSPRGLSIALLGYTVFTVAGAYVVGANTWFRYVEFFSVLFRLLGKLAPVSYRGATAGRPAGWRLRWPGAGLMESRPEHLSEVVFILFMLSSTAFDGLHNTQLWALLFWQDIFAALSPWLGTNLVAAYAILKPLYFAYQSLALVLSPWLYLAFLAGCLYLMSKITRRRVAMLDLLCRFSYSLLPIVVVYHFTHYFTLVLGQGPQLLPLLSDPLGMGWNLLARSSNNVSGVMLDMGWVWHVQVGMILFGHIASVFVAHDAARQLFNSSRQVWLSQLPLLVLMMAFTVFGLWILAQPLDTLVLR